jgi:5-formyltetrahydrofolate cyclo-ligase
MEAAIREEKTKLRRKILDSRSPAQVIDSAIFYKHALLKLCKQLEAKKVGCYISFGTEPRTSDFIEEAGGIEIFVPKVLDSNEMVFVPYSSNQTKNKLGFSEPAEVKGVEAKLDLIVLPALAINHHGFRLGRGGGYFDKYLEHFQGVTVALIFDEEVLDHLPMEEHDRKVMFAITPTKVLDFRH